VFETTEVFLELAGLKFGGPAGRWAVIVAVQVNCMGFTSKKLPNNILKNVFLKRFSIG
jgi:hypothetical protein